MTLGKLLEVINKYEFITVFDVNEDIIVDDCINNMVIDDELKPYLTAMIDNIDTGITNSHGSLHAVISITIKEVKQEEEKWKRK